MPGADIRFPTAASKEETETNTTLTPRFDKDGLVACVASDAKTGEVVMLAYMDAEALAETIRTGEAHYWSRSRKSQWKKGETSGNVQKVVEMRVDCDQDAIWIRVETAGDGVNCHTGAKSCFYRSVALGSTTAGPVNLVTDPAPRER